LHLDDPEEPIVTEPQDLGVVDQVDPVALVGIGLARLLALIAGIGVVVLVVRLKKESTTFTDHLTDELNQE
jgi:hypothetical protein